MTEEHIHNWQVLTFTSGPLATWTVSFFRGLAIAMHPMHAPRWCPVRLISTTPFYKWPTLNFNSNAVEQLDAPKGSRVYSAHPVSTEEFEKHSIGDIFRGEVVVDGAEDSIFVVDNDEVGSHGCEMLLITRRDIK